MELDAVGKAIEQYHLVPLVSHSNMGLEVTMQRVNGHGELSTQPYPAIFGDQRQNRQIHNAFAQTQLKMTTPAMNDVSQLMAYLTGLNTTVRRQLAADEYLWPLSSTPVLPDDLTKIPLAEADELGFKRRQQQAKKYDITKLMTTGVHVNLSFNEQLFTRLYTETFHQQYSSYVEFRNAIYLKAAQGFVRMNWLIQYLFGATPTLQITDKTPAQRSSVHGPAGRYSQVVGDYTTIDRYVTKLQADVRQKSLLSISDFDGPVRFRSTGQLTTLARQGVYYLEFRGLDLDPTTATGVDQNAVEFLRLLASYFVMMPALPATMVPKVSAQADQLTAQVTTEDPTQPSAQAQPALQVLDALRDFAAAHQLPASDLVLLDHLKKRVADHQQTLSAQVAAKTDALAWANHQAATFQTAAQAEPFKLPGFEQVDLSSQLLATAALARGIKVDQVAADTNILRLTHGDRAQLVVDGSGTDLNPQALTTVLQNKVAAKQVLAEHGVQVPASQTYHSANQLIDDYDRYVAAGGIALKATDRSHAVVAFRIMPQRALFERVVRQLFEQAPAIMAEELIVASSYRFLVLGGKVRAIVERIPANIVGDGRSTVQTLLDNKNHRALRGPAFKYPQSQLKLGTIERYRLDSYHLDLDTVVGRGTQILLREDATFGNGADVLDATEDMHQSYIEAVEKLAAELNLQVAGFDVMIPNLYAELTPEHPEMAVYLGVHAAPFLYPHMFPMFGDAQPVASQLLDLLF
ncbi:bifunctional glutamate--cysteine ligase GshA/glutathione synthetase GshB [Lactiplantibacillus fabifermentans]|uniref:glutamate--cysteine ligase n=2 Tax=Lactiplantibacillus fabifermentans TaxID=483011 RepID=A0A0R2NCN5_9LACO|nr:bifunctional glutamate--cysteine ligase GshA/glutathione synthetase GshB [Lactiplantibacillus fabifermentans]ETY73780.1 glutathione synthetase [Lactiplantibacillus fabifermentans T30PCM01]KRO22283.1 bifunctional glutamate--cysteine ligase glutathione synthetase [Lactiplantibacillus fabifermentans DSM 21115]